MESFWSQTMQRSLSGDYRFRLMPADGMIHGPASGQVAPVAGGYGVVLSYTWEHAEDGPQSGVLLVASSDDDGTITGTLLDSWHQKPGPMRLTGDSTGPAACHLTATFAGDWGWEVDLTVGEEVRMVMRNVVPESAVTEEQALTIKPGPYDVMVMTLQ